MRIIIEECTVSLWGREYWVTKDKQIIYRIRRSMLSAKPKFVIIDDCTEKKIGTFQNKLLSLKADAIIRVPSGSYKFDQKEINSMTYTCQQLSGGEANYRVQGHKAFCGSIFKNEKQIGYWKKNKYSFFNNDFYDVDLDGDADVLLMAAMTVLFDSYRISAGLGFGFEMDNMGKGVTSYKSDWTPNDEINTDEPV